MPEAAPSGAPSGAPALSGKLMQLKFMQKANAKRQHEELETKPVEEAKWVKEGSSKRCVVVQDGDPPLLRGNRLSFGGMNPALEAGGASRNAPSSEAVLSDQDLAQELRKRQAHTNGGGPLGVRKTEAQRSGKDATNPRAHEASNRAQKKPRA